MQDRPSAAELVDAVREFVEAELLPEADDPRLRYRTLVALGALGIVARELAEGVEPLRREVSALARLLEADASLPPDDAELRCLALRLRADLAGRIRAGDPPEGTLVALVALARDKLQVASPRARREDGGAAASDPSKGVRPWSGG